MPSCLSLPQSSLLDRSDTNNSLCCSSASSQARSVFPEGLRSKTLDHHGLVATVCKELRVAELIDSKIPPPTGCKVTHGERVVAMIINGLGFVQRTLYMSPCFFRGKPVDRLIGAHVDCRGSQRRRVRAYLRCPV